MFRIIPAAYDLDEDLSVARLLACRIEPPRFGLSVMAVAAAAAPACFSPRRIEGGTPSRRTSHLDSRRCRARTSVGRYSWARYYHPGLHRFLSEDPIGIRGGDLNFYAYVGNNPLRLVDPLGFYDISRIAGGVVGVVLGGVAVAEFAAAGGAVVGTLPAVVVAGGVILGTQVAVTGVVDIITG